MLVQASRDGDLDVVLRLLYTNPFVDDQELRNALWEAARCKRLEVLRSLIEFRVDPEATASPELSAPPSALQHVPWTPLLALAVNDDADRAKIVAELINASAPRTPRGTRQDSSKAACCSASALAAGNVSEASCQSSSSTSPPPTISALPLSPNLFATTAASLKPATSP